MTIFIFDFELIFDGFIVGGIDVLVVGDMLVEIDDE